MEGGMIAMPPYEPGTEITYSCRPGWKLVGASTSMCQGVNFEWTLMGDDVPQCLQGNTLIVGLYKPRRF